VIHKSDAERVDSDPHFQDINNVLKEHAASIEDWRYHEFVQFLHEWADRFNRELGLDIKTPAIQIARIRVWALGHYRYGRNGFGLRHQVTFNLRHLERPVADLLETLLHELLHEWQELCGKPGKGNYHNRQFREKARSYGLLVDHRGRSLGIQAGPFTKLLAQHSVDAFVLPPPQGEFARSRPIGKSKLKKWSCGCTNVRAAVEVEALCLKCGAPFQKAGPAW